MIPSTCASRPKSTASLSMSYVTMQKEWVRAWVEKRTGFKSNFEIRFYPARYDGEGFFSIFPVGKQYKLSNDLDCLRIDGYT